MKKFIISLLTVSLLLNPYFTTIYAEESDEIVDTTEQTEEIIQNEEEPIEEVSFEEDPEISEEEPILPIEEIENNENQIKELIKPTEIEGPRLNKNVEDELSFSQDADKNLIIVPKETGFFDELDKDDAVIINYYESKEDIMEIRNTFISSAESYKSNDNQFLETNRGYTIHSGANGPEYIFISAETCKANNIGSGIVQISINTHKTEKAQLNSVCKVIADSVTITEDTENHRLKIESNDKDFLKALIFPREEWINEETGVYRCFEGSRIYLSDYTTGEPCGGFQNSKFGPNTIEKKIEYDETAKCAYIQEDTIKGENILNDVYRLNLYAYGYEGVETSVTLASLGCKESPNENDLTFSFENDKLIINCEDKEYLEALAKPELFSAGSGKYVVEEYGSNICLYIGSDATHGNDRFFSNKIQKNYSSDTSNIEYYYDNINKYVYVPIALLMKNDVMKNDKLMHARLYAYGYSSLDISGLDVAITNGCVEHPNDIEVEENENGDIVIHSNNIEYLRALVADQDLYTPNYFSRVEVTTSNYGNYACFYNGRFDDALEIDEDANTVTISNEYTIDNRILNGNVDIVIATYGYTKYSTSIELFHQSLEAPTGVLVSVNSSGDIVITCSDTNWINALARQEGNVSFNNNGEQVGDIWSNINNQFLISNNGKTATIKRDRVVDAGIVNGTYALKIYAEGYATLPLSKTIKITNGAKFINPDKVDVNIDEDSDSIIITSSNADFIKNLFASSEEWYYSSSPSKYVKGGRITFRNYDEQIYETFESITYYYNGKTSGKDIEIQKSSDGKSIILSTDIIYDKDIIKGLSYDIIITAKGYASISKTIENLQIGVMDTQLNDIGVSFDQNEGLIITSNDSAWLDGIVKNKTAAYIRLNSNEMGGITFSNHNRDGEILRKDGKVIIPIEELYYSYLSTGNYSLNIHSYGYEPYSYSDRIYIVTKKVATSPVTINQGEGKLIINSDDKDFIKALSFESATQELIDRHIESHVLLNISEDSENIYLENYLNTRTIFYDNEKEYAYIDINLYKEILKQYSNLSGNVHFIIEAFGYEAIEKDFQLKLIQYDSTEVVAGTTEQLSFADFDKSKVTWSSLNEAIATIDENGVLKGEKVGKATITAKYTADDGSDTYDSIDVKITSNTKVSLKLQTEDANTLAMVGTSEQLVLTVKNYTLTDNDEITYTSSNEDIATISDTGLVTFSKPGKVTITAEAVNKKATLTLSVYNYDKSLKVSLTSNEKFLEVEDENLDVLSFKAGNEEISTSDTTYTSSNPSIISVDENGLLTAHKKGTAKITAAITGDPSNRKATISIQVVDTIARSLDIEKLTVDTVEGVDFTTDQVVNDVRVIIMNYSQLSKTTKFHINTSDSGLDKRGDHFIPAKISFSSTDSSVASVDKNGYVTFKKAGQVTITVTVASNPKGYEVISKEIILKAVDYAPRIEENKFTLNKYYIYGNEEGEIKYPTYSLHKVLNTTIDGCRITDLNGEVSELFDVELDSQSDQITDKYSIAFAGDPLEVPAKTYSQLLWFKIGDNWYKYKVSIIVVSTIPSVTPKINGFYNTFTNENTLELVSTVKNGEIEDIVVDFDNNWADIDYDPGTGIAIIEPHDNNGKIITSGKVYYSFKGYSGVYQVKTIKLTTKSVKPTVKLYNPTITLYVPNNTIQEKEIVEKLIDENNNLVTTGFIREIITNDYEVIDGEDVDFKNGILTVNLKEVKPGKMIIKYANNSWADDAFIPLTLNVKVSNIRPKVKASSNILNMHYKKKHSDSITLSLPGSSEEIYSVECPFEQFDVSEPSYSDGKVTFTIQENGYMSPGSSYYINNIYLIPKLADGTELEHVNVSIDVENDRPKVKLKNYTVKMNQSLGWECVPVEYSLTDNKYDYSLYSIDVSAGLISATGSAGWSIYKGIQMVDGYVENGKMYFYLSDDGRNLPSGKYKVMVYPRFTGDDACTSYQGFYITLDLYKKNPTVTATVKSAINPLDKSSTSLITVKLANIADEIDAIDIENGLFETVKVNDEFFLKLKDDADLSGIKDQTIKTNAHIKLKNDKEEYPDGLVCAISIKLARKAPTVKLITPTVNVYDTTVAEGEIVGETIVSYDYDNYEIDIEGATIPLSLGYKVEYDETDHKFIVKMIDGSKIKSGSTQSFNIRLVWKNDFTNNGKYTKTSTLKLNVKDASYTNAADNKIWYVLPAMSWFANDYCGTSYEETVSNLKAYFIGKFNKVTYKKVSNQVGEGQIVQVTVNGKTEYEAGQYDPNVPIVIEICNKQITE